MSHRSRRAVSLASFAAVLLSASFAAAGEPSKDRPLEVPHDTATHVERRADPLLIGAGALVFTGAYGAQLAVAWGSTDRLNYVPFVGPGYFAGVGAVCLGKVFAGDTSRNDPTGGGAGLIVCSGIVVVSILDLAAQTAGLVAVGLGVVGHERRVVSLPKVAFTPTLTPSSKGFSISGTF